MTTRTVRELLHKARTPSNDLLQNRQSAREGITPGGFFHDTDGARWYVKFHRQPEHAYNEHLANQVYRRTGNHAPLSYVGEHPSFTGRTLYASKQMHPAFHTLDEVMDRKGVPVKFWDTNDTITSRARNSGHGPLWELLHPSTALRHSQGLATDALLDVEDHHAKNIGLIPGSPKRDPGGRVATTAPRLNPEARRSTAERWLPVRLDNGGALLFDAHGDARISTPTLVRDFRAPAGVVGAYHRVRNALSDEERERIGFQHIDPMRSVGLLLPGLQRINATHDQHGGWQRLVDRALPRGGAGSDWWLGPSTKAFGRYVAERLRQRHDQLIDHVSDLLNDPDTRWQASRQRPVFWPQRDIDTGRR